MDRFYTICFSLALTSSMYRPHPLKFEIPNPTESENGLNKFNCDKLNSTMPDRVKCPSYDHITENINDGSISIFCRFMSRELCFLNFSSDPELQQRYEDWACSRNHLNINTSTKLALNIKSKMKEIHEKNCIVSKKELQENVKFYKFGKNSPWLTKL